MKRRVLIVQCRGLGDAIISTSFIKSLHESWDDVSIDVWASREVAPIFESHSFVNRCYVQRFPVLKRHRWNVFSPLRLGGQVLKLRGNNYDIAVNMAGDARENFLTWLVGAKTTWSVRWADGHPVKELLHPGLSRIIDRTTTIPESCRNIYDVYQRVANEVQSWGGRSGPTQVVQVDSESRKERHVGTRIGIHPLASQACREWPFEEWRSLISRILERGYYVMVFGAPEERKILEEEFKAQLADSRVSLVSEDLGGFFAALRTLSGFVGLDSFGVHAAYAEGVPSVMINGANDPAAWAPPDASVVGNGGGCRHYPCFNRPRCKGTSLEYVCVRSVSVSEVCSALVNKVGEAVLINAPDCE